MSGGTENLGGEFVIGSLETITAVYKAALVAGMEG
jgi:hypothetical protein